MAQNILLAGLGDHPAVITGMVKALREIEGIHIDVLHILHPQETGKHIEGIALPQILEHLSDTCRSEPVPLGFTDANTVDDSMQFLQILTGVLERYKDPENYRVYMSLAGGRKNMAALMALVAQFFPSVRGLYHLLDLHEDSRDVVFPSIEEILYMPPDKVQETFDPPLKRLNLIHVPYPGAFATSNQLRPFLQDSASSTAASPVPLTSDAEEFWRRVFGAKPNIEKLEVWLSQTALEQYEQAGSEDKERFFKCFKQMQEPDSLKKGHHYTVKGRGKPPLYVYKRTNRQRPFFYTEPNSVERYPQEPIDKVIICGLSIEYALGTTGPYKPDEDWQFQHASRQAFKPLSELNVGERTLLVPLGRSPMIATQTYQLLQESEEEGYPRILTVAVLYPERSPIIDNGVRLLRRLFEKRNVEFLTYPVRGLRDIDSSEACEQYLSVLLHAIEDLRQKYPDRQIDLSLSGGRKGMSALALFAAQRAGIEKIYHTLITDIELEAEVERKNSIEALQKLPTDEEKARRLFLDLYDKDKFHLFSIPVIPVISKDA